MGGSFEAPLEASRLEGERALGTVLVRIVLCVKRGGAMAGLDNDFVDDNRDETYKDAERRGS